MVKRFCDILGDIEELPDPEPPPQVYLPAATKPGRMRSALEVLARMYNGVDPFDPNRYRAAVAALPHETPKLTMNTSQNLNMTANFGIAATLERARLRVIDGGGGDRPSPDESTELPPEPA